MTGDPDATATNPVDGPPQLAALRNRGLGRGEQLERYVVLEPLGSGGMGEVYAAYDPALDRRVALKLLHPAAGSSTGGPEGHARLLREGQAMARLSHPNVLTVYDVGVVGDEVFIAMEVAEGGTLRDWMREKPRDWREVVDVFVRAGRGLAAAHAAGIVHRDFKPANVLMTADGGVRVMDFGLARSQWRPGREETGARPEPRNEGSTLLAAGLTRSGAQMGTPAYMAPEQHRGEHADFASDQFAFCVALYEGLYGVRPFAGDTEEELAERVATGPPVELPREPRIPQHVRRVLVRGLQRRAEDRYPSMDALLADLRDDSRWLRPRRLLAIAIVAIGAATFLGFSAGRQDVGDTCEESSERLEAFWNEDRRREIREVFSATELPYAAGAWDRTADVTDAYLERWRSAYLETCTAAREGRGIATGQPLDQQMACLDDRLAQVRTLLDVFSHPDSKLVGRALEAARALSPVEDCADVDALRRQVAPPRDPRLRVEVARVREALDRVRALDRVGKYAEARELAQRTLTDAEALDYPAVHAEARLAAGTGELRVGEYAAAEKLFYEAIEAAEAAGHELVKARAWIEAIWVVGDRQGRSGDAKRLVGLAEAAIQRAGGDLELQVSLERNRGVLARNQRRFDDAIKHYQRALDMLDDAGAIDDRERGRLHNNLAAVYYESGDPARAVAASRRAVELSSAFYGDDHPSVAAMQGNLGALLVAAGSLDEGEVALKQALRGFERAYGPEHPRMPDVLTNLGGLASRREQHEAAREYFERALAIDEKVLPPDHPNLAVDHGNLAIELSAIGDNVGARTHFERAVELHREAAHPDRVGLARSLTQLAATLGKLGDEAAGLKHAAAAARLLEEAGQHPHYDESVFDLGRTLVELGGDVDRGVALAKKARAAAAARSPSDARLLGEIDGWLKERAR